MPDFINLSLLKKLKWILEFPSTVPVTDSRYYTSLGAAMTVNGALKYELNELS